MLKRNAHISELIGTVKKGNSHGKPVCGTLDRNGSLAFRAIDNSQYVDWGLVNFSNVAMPTLEQRLKGKYEEQQAIVELYHRKFITFSELTLIDQDPRLWEIAVSWLKSKGYLGPLVPLDLSEIGEKTKGEEIYADLRSAYGKWTLMSPEGVARAARYIAKCMSGKDDFACK